MEKDRLSEVLKDYTNLAQSTLNALNDETHLVVSEGMFTQICNTLPLVGTCRINVDFNRFLRYEGDNIIFDTGYLKSLLDNLIGVDGVKVRWFGDIPPHCEDPIDEICERIMLIKLAENVLHYQWQDNNSYLTSDGKRVTPNDLYNLYEGFTNFVEK